MLEKPFPERHLCIHENPQHDLCLYPCPYDLHSLHLTQEDGMQYIDLNDIFHSQMLWYLLTMICPAWKTSSNSEEDEEESWIQTSKYL